MEIVRIFGDDSLLTVQYDDCDQDEFSKIFSEWTDIEFLENFFEENKGDLDKPEWGYITIEKAVRITRDEAIKLRKHFYDLSKKRSTQRIESFAKLFKPFIKQVFDEDYLARKKAYGLRAKSWLRIYALKIDTDMYLITGGTIKLTDKMSQRDHTKKEIQKIEMCKQILYDEGLLDKDGMIELLEL